MLSICIPVFNDNVCKLVAALHAQCLDCKIDFEILLADDCSNEESKEVNRSVLSFEHVFLLELSENIGRAAIRNFLIEKARFAYLLFLDADTEIFSNAFIFNYLSKPANVPVICGGVVFSPIPAREGFRLRQHYGRKREALPSTVRSLQPYRSFLTTNFLIEKSVAQQFKFNEQIRKYGHEDTLFGLELERNGIKIQHIENPILHLAEDTDEAFIQKTEQAVVNLVLLENEFAHYDHVQDKIKLLKYHSYICRFKLVFIVRLMFPLLNKLNRKLLFFAPTRLFFLDLYKLALYVKLKSLHHSSSNT